VGPQPGPAYLVAPCSAERSPRGLATLARPRQSKYTVILNSSTGRHQPQSSLLTFDADTSVLSCKAHHFSRRSRGFYAGFAPV